MRWLTKASACFLGSGLLAALLVAEQHERRAQEATTSLSTRADGDGEQATPTMTKREIEELLQQSRTPDAQAWFDEWSSVGSEMTNPAAIPTTGCTSGICTQCSTSHLKARAQPAGFDYGCPAWGPTFGVDGGGEWCSATAFCPSGQELYCEGYVGAPSGSCYSKANLVSCEGNIWYC